MVDVQRSELEKVVSTLDRFLISEDVEIIDVSDRLGCVAALGNRVYEYWNMTPEAKSQDELLLFSYGMITKSAPNLLLARKSGGLIELGVSQTHATQTNSYSGSPSPGELASVPGRGVGMRVRANVWERVGVRLHQGIRFLAHYFCAPTIYF